MGRGKVQLKRIENKINRQVTFSKRRAGLHKKALEISVLCDAEVALIVFSHKGKLFEYSTDSCMDSILERYERYSYAERQLIANEPQSPANWTLEHNKLKARIELLLRNQRHYMGEDLESMNLKDLQNLEQQLENGLKSIRIRKNQLLCDSIVEMQRKAKAIQDQNSSLTKKIKEREQGLANHPSHQQQHNGTTVHVHQTMQPPPQYLMASQLPCLNVGATYEGETAIEARRNELDLTLDSICSCHLGCFAA